VLPDAVRLNVTSGRDASEARTYRVASFFQRTYAMQTARLFSTFLYLLPLALLGWLASCSDSSRGTADVEAVLTSGEGLLRYVPDDTPYVFASLESVPDEVLNKLAPHIEPLVQTYADMLKAGIDLRSDDADEAPFDDETRARLSAVIDELAAVITAEGIPEAGIDRKSTAAFYGVGLLPVLRVTLSDAALFEPFMEKLESRAGSRMDVATVDGHTYRYAGNDEARIVVGVFDDHLVIAGIPTNVAEATFKSVVGLSPPAKSIANSGTLARLAGKYGLSAYGVGLIDIERIASTFIDPPSGVNAELLQLMEYDASSMSDVCKQELRSAAGIVPRVVTGYTELTSEHFKSTSVIELRSDIATGMQTLTAAVPGLGIGEGGLMSFGMSLNPIAAREFYSARLDALEADPYQCEYFAHLQSGISSGRALLDQPLPPTVYSFLGFLAVVDDIKGMDLRNQQPPTSIDMRLLVASDNPEALLATGAMFSPEVAALNLKADSTPMKLDVPALASTVEATWVAMSDNALAMSFGDGSEKGLEAMLGAGYKEPSPFLSMNMDAERYYGFIGDAMALDDSDDRSPEVTKASADVMKTLEKMFRRIAFDVNFTENGVEIPSTVELAD